MSIYKKNSNYKYCGWEITGFNKKTKIKDYLFKKKKRNVKRSVI